MRPAPAQPTPQGAPQRWPQARRAGFIATLLCLAALLVWGAGEWAEQSERDAQWDNLRRLGEVQALALRGVATRYNYLPFTAAQHPLVRRLLQRPATQAVRDAANAYLQAVNQHAGSDMLYVMDPQGLTLASSNWDTPNSFVHQNYGNRPYFRDALAGQTGRFYGVGKTTGEPGLFVSAPVVEAGRVIGVVAVKVRMEPISDPWAQLRDPVFVTDEQGIVFLGSVPDWLYRTSRPLPAPLVQQLQHNEQYGTGWALRAVPWTLRPQDDSPGAELRLDGPSGKRYLAFEEKLPDLGWTLTVTADSRLVTLARQQAWALATLASGLLVLGALYWQLRERRLAETRLARIELEQRVQ